MRRRSCSRPIEGGRARRRRTKSFAWPDVAELTIELATEEASADIGPGRAQCHAGNRELGHSADDSVCDTARGRSRPGEA